MPRQGTPSLPDFAGRWRVARAVRHAGGGAARFAGSARWTPQADGFDCDEAGRLRAGGVAVEATRRTLWRTEGDRIVVAFGDGRAFHRIGPGATVEAAHDCPPDAYRLLYDFTRWPCWSVTWRVTGPRKDYVARTRYARD